MDQFGEWVDAKEMGEDARVLCEGSGASRYSVEVNYRTQLQEVIDAYAKICLGYVSAALKNCGYHVKTLFTAKPYRVIVGSRAWDDGEWVAMAVFNHQESKFVIAEGSFNRDRKTVTIQRSRRTEHHSANEIVRDLRGVMESLKRRDPPRPLLEPAQLKRGPKPGIFTKIKKLAGPWKPRRR